MDFALIAQAATLESRLPFLHFFDGFRTSAEVMKIEQLTVDDIRAMVNDELVFRHRQRALTPEKPVLRGTAQNPDTFFQSRETVNPFYAACPDIVQKTMDKFAKLVGRQYHLFDYFGAPDAERIIVIMGSGAEVIHETVEALMAKGEKVGVLKVHLFRPFSVRHFAESLPKSVKSIAVLDRTKEPGSAGEPLYQDIVTAFGEAMAEGFSPVAVVPRIIGGRLRVVVERVYTGDGKSRVRRTQKIKTEEPFHGGHQRRRLAYESRIRCHVHDGKGRRGAGDVLRARRGRNGRSEQKLHQNYW